LAASSEAEALSLPVGALPDRLMEIKALKDRLIILVCRTDKRSASAAAILREAGFRDVRALRGGMEQWQQSHGRRPGAATLAVERIL